MRIARASFASLALCVFANASTAHATPNFPEVLQAYVPMPFTPECATCHVGEETTGSVTSPFGMSMRARGLVADDEDALKLAVDALRAEGTDSDHDGVGDIAELEAGTDPNIAPGADPAPELQYGCGARIANGSSNDGTALIVLICVGLLLARRRRA